MRHELKFVTESTNIDTIYKWLHDSRFLFYKKFEDRTVNNVYFDNNEFSSYKENVIGVSRRQKLRYRWYGKSSVPMAGTLEVKNKSNSVNWKENFSIKKSPYKQGDTWRDIITNIKDYSNNNKTHLLFQEYSIPVVINRYDRQYYESKTDNVRITIDQNLSAYQQHSLIKPNFLNKSYMDDFIVIECKIPQDQYNNAKLLLKTFPVTRTKMSKYVYCGFCNFN